MSWFRRKPLITDRLYGDLMTSFGRVVDLDPLVAGPAAALAERIVREGAQAAAAFDATTYAGAAQYHLRLLGGAWILAAEGQVPRKTAEVFEEAVAWRMGRAGRASGQLAGRLGAIARPR
jgi:hypothetical protein